MNKQTTIERFTHEPTNFTGWRLIITTPDGTEHFTQYFSDKHHGSEEAALAAAQAAQTAQQAQANQHELTTKDHS